MRLKQTLIGLCTGVAALGMLAGAAMPGDDTCTTAKSCTDDEQVICIKLGEGGQQIELSKDICLQISKALTRTLQAHVDTPIVARILLSCDGDLEGNLIECLLECDEDLLKNCEKSCDDACMKACEKGCDEDCMKACEKSCEKSCDSAGQSACTDACEGEQAVECMVVCEDGIAKAQDGGRAFVLNANAMQIGADGHEVKIMRECDDSGDRIQLWVDGKEYKVGSESDVQAVLKKLGCNDVSLMFAPDKKVQLNKTVQVKKPMMIQQGKTLTLKGGEGGEGQMFTVSPGVLGQDGDDQQRLVVKRLGQEDGEQAFMEHPKAMLGVVLDAVPDLLRDYLRLDENAGVSVTQVLDDTPAQKAGLEVGDIIVAVRAGKADWKTADEESLRGVIADSEPGTVLEVKYLRAGKADKTKVTLGKWDSDLMGGVIVGEPDEMLELHGLEFPEGEGDGVWEWSTPGDGEGQFKIVIEPGQIEGMIEGFEIDGKKLEDHILKMIPEGGKPMKAQPIPGQYRELEEMMELLEQQMKEMEKMFERLHKQQNEINKKLKEAKSLDA